MIKIEPKINELGQNDGSIRELKPEEKDTVTSYGGFRDGFYTWYQGDEPKTEPPIVVEYPNWSGLKSGLWDSVAFMKVVGGLVTVNQIAFTALTIVLTDGETKGASQAAFFRMFAALGANFSDSDLAEINSILKTNNFSGEV